MLCLTMGILSMSMATLYIPVIVLKARKFALLFSFGSVFFLSRFALHSQRDEFTDFHSSFSMLWGPTNHLKHLTSMDRLPFSITYIVTLLGTIYYSVWVSASDDVRTASANEMSPSIVPGTGLNHRRVSQHRSSFKRRALCLNSCVVEKERRLALPLTRTEGFRTYTITPGKAWRLAPATWLDFFHWPCLIVVFLNARSKVISSRSSLLSFKSARSSGNSSRCFNTEDMSAQFRYIVSYIPGGARGLKFFSKLFYTFVSKTVTTTLSV